METQFKAKDGEVLNVRSLKAGDAEILKKFGLQLSNASKILFCPYPWEDQSKLSLALGKAVEKALSGIDSSYLIFNPQIEPVGHFFLWKAGGNPLSKKFGVEVPELGVAIADSYQGKGLGYFAVEFLKKIAADTQSDAIELTTAPANQGGSNTYAKSGFEYVGNILNPLEVDVTEAAEGKTVAQKYRAEKQMVYIINPDKKKGVLEYLKYKRELKK